MPLEGLEVAFHEPGPTYVPPLTSSLPSRPLAQTLAVGTARFLSPPGGPPAEPQGCWALWHLVYLPQAVPETGGPGSRLSRKHSGEAFGVIFGWARRLLRVAGALWARSWIPRSQGQGRPRIPCLNFLPLIPPRNEACQSSNSWVFTRRLW